MKSKLKFELLLWWAIVPLFSFSQVDSDFWFVIPEVTPRHHAGGVTEPYEPTALRISAVGDDVHVVIEMPAYDTILWEGNIMSGNTYSHLLTDEIEKSYGDSYDGTESTYNILESGIPTTEGVVSNRGIHIYSQGLTATDRNKNITVYCDRFHINNKDIWSLKGSNALGNNFTIPSQNIWPNKSYTSPPQALYGFDIVATKNNTNVTIKAVADIQVAGGAVISAGTQFTITLQRGETYACVATGYDIEDRLGGSIVSSDEPIAVTWRDDSVRPIGSGYDLMGDQLIPDRLAGKEFVIMRGELSNDSALTQRKKSREYAFIMAIEDNTTLLNTNCDYGMFINGEDKDSWPTDSTTVLQKGQIGRLLMNARNYNNRLGGVDVNKENYDALYFEMSKPVIVIHVTGFGDELGGAVVPTIDLCTGSKDVSVVRSTNQSFFINLMTKTLYIDSIDVFIGNTSYHIPKTAFSPVLGTDWWYLAKPNNNFSTNASVIGVQAPVNQATKVKIKSEGRFHLSTIEGNNAGCKYGYFSSFSSDFGSANIGNDDATGFERYCYGETIELESSGGLTYKWEYLSGGMEEYHEFLTDSTIQNPLARILPPSPYIHTYQVTIHRDCDYQGNASDTTVGVDVYVWNEFNADFDTVSVSGNCCSPNEIKLINNNQPYVNYHWSIENETGIDERTVTHITDTILFTNSGYNPISYDIQLVANQNYQCYDTLTLPVTVNPLIHAAAQKGAKSGCQQDVTKTYIADTVGSGPWTSLYWNWGDGMEEEHLRSTIEATADPLNLSFTHLFQNLNNTDTNYFVTVVFIDSVHDCSDSLIVDTLLVPGVARARFIASERQGCSPFTVDFENKSNGVVSYVWDFGNGIISTTGADTAISYFNNTALPIDYNVSLTITKTNTDSSVCTDIYGPETITVYPEFKTQINTPDTAACNPLTLTMSQTTTEDIATNYYWQLGDGSTSANKTDFSKTYAHFYDTDQTFTVNLMAESEYGCRDTADPVNITVYSYIDALFTVLPDTVGCSPKAFNISNNTSPNAGITNSIWTDNGVVFNPIGNDFNLDYINQTGENEVHNIVLSNANAHNCELSYEKQLVVYPELVAQFSANELLVCDSTAIDFTNESFFKGSFAKPHSFEWDFGDGGTLVSDSNQTIVSHIFQNTLGNSIQDYTVTLRAYANGCFHDTSMVVSVQPRLRAILSADAYRVCTPDTIHLSNNSLTGTSYTWQFSANPAMDTIVNNTQGMDYIVSNSTLNDIEVHTVTLTASNTSIGCSHSTVKTFQVYPEIKPNITAIDSMSCAPFEVEFVNTSSGGVFGSDLVFDWNFNDGNSNMQNDSSFSYVYQNKSANDRVYTVSITASNGAGCSATSQLPVTVFPEVKANFSMERNTFCSPHPVTFVNNSLNGNNFAWDFNALNDTTTINKNTFEYLLNSTQANSPTLYTVILIASDTLPGHVACRDTLSNMLTIYPEVISNFVVDSASNQGCSPLTLPLLNNSTGYELTYTWDYNDGHQSADTTLRHYHSFNNYGANDTSYTITLEATDVNGCSNSSTQTVSAFPLISANFNYETATLCSPHPVTFSNLSSSGSNTFAWDFGYNNNTLDTNRANFDYLFENTHSNADSISTYTIWMKAMDSDHPQCADSISKEISIYPEVIAAFNVANNEGCSPLNATFTNLSSGYNLNYVWDYDDGLQSADTGYHDHVFNNKTAADVSYNVSLTTTDVNGCSASVQHTVTAYPLVQSNFNFEMDGLCSPHPVKFNNLCSQGANLYEWDHALLSTPYITNTTNQVEFNFYNTHPNPDSISIYDVKLIATNSNHPECVDSIIKQVNIYPEVIADFSITNTIGCSPITTELSDASHGYALSYKWNYGDGLQGNDSSLHEHTFNNLTANDVDYNIVLTVTDANGCSNSTSDTVTAFPLINPDFTYYIQDQCAYPRNVVFENTTAMGGDRFIWNFGFNGETLVTDRSTFDFDFYNTHSHPDSISVYQITMHAENAMHAECSDSVSKLIEIYPEVIPGFTINNDEGCSPLESEFTNTSEGFGLRYVWSYGDGNTSSNTNESHTNVIRNLDSVSHDYEVFLIVRDAFNCSYIHNDVVTVYPEVVAGFTKEKLDVCTPFPVAFNYPDVALNGNKFIWDLGFDGNDSIVKNSKTAFNFSYDNHTLNEVQNYNVRLVSIDSITGCTDSVSQVVEVYPQLHPAFEPDTNQGCNPLTVQFENQSTGLGNYYWDFKDGQTSSLESPEHVFSHLLNHSVDYNVNLKVVQQNTGCTKYVEEQITSYSYLNAAFGVKRAEGTQGSISTQTVAGCSPFTVEISDSSTTNAFWQWEFDADYDPIIDESAPPRRSFVYTNTDGTEPLSDSIYTIKLIVENQQGCTKEKEQNVLVYPRSIPDFQMDAEGCHPHMVEFENNTVMDDSTKFLWKIWDVPTDVGQELTHVFENLDYFENAVYDVWLVSTTKNLCVDSVRKQITVYPKPFSKFNAIQDRGCPPFTAELANTSLGSNLEYLWDFADGTSNESNELSTEYPVYTNNTLETITHNVSLVATSAYNCSDTAIRPIYVYPNVIADINLYDLSDTAGCSPHVVEFKNESNAAASEFTWSFGTNNDTSRLVEPTYRYLNTSIVDEDYIVTLHAESEYGCDSTVTDTITVYLTPNAEFNVYEPVQDYPNLSVDFERLTKEGPWSYFWDLGDGFTTDTNAVLFEHTYNTWAPKLTNFTYNIWYYAFSEHCADSSLQTITVYPPQPEVDILTDSLDGCVPYTVQFESEQYFGYEESLYWTFGDGNVGYGANPEHTYDTAGTFVVRLFIDGDGGASFANTIVEVHPLPELGFTFTPDLVMLPDQKVQFYNTTNHGVEYVWRFGDEVESTEMHPTHLYSQVGVYDIELVATSPFGCKDSTLQYEAVMVSGEGFIRFPNTFLASADSPLDGTYPIPDHLNNVFHPHHTGIKEYTLWIFNRWGEQLFISNDELEGWNGRYGNDGDILPQDVYFWKAKGTYQNDVPFKVSGDITLIRK